MIPKVYYINVYAASNTSPEQVLGKTHETRVAADRAALYSRQQYNEKPIYRIRVTLK